MEAAFIILQMFLRKTRAYELDEIFTNSLPSKTFNIRNVFEVDFFVFSGTALSTSSFISSSATKVNQKKFWEIGEYLVNKPLWVASMSADNVGS